MAYIPVTPLPVLPPAPAGQAPPSWLGPTSPWNVGLAFAQGIAQGATSAAAVHAAGGTPTQIQAAFIRGAAIGLGSGLPGGFIVSLPGAIFKSIVGDTLSNYYELEARENPTFFGTPTDLSELTTIIRENPGDWARIQANAARLEAQREAARIAAQRPSDRIGIDPRTGAGISRRTLALESDAPARLAEVRLAELRQRLPSFGVPSIFTRRRN